MIQTNYNPDVLTCLANLSNDEIFTPPNLVNDMLDLLPADLWINPKAKFLDPVCKTGVFLREIAKRLMFGLEIKIPDKQARINHILKNQLYGIAITELTSLLSRRSVYCSKKANHEKYSLCTEFNDGQGNIRYENTEHTWQNKRCTFCGASQEIYEREDTLETYAYNFIHTNKPEKIFNMRFDVIIGNPPYQLSDGGAQMSAGPIYHKFIQQAKQLNPKYLTMIIPARWYNGGKGLDDFRREMLNDRRISELHDFPDTSDCFPGINNRGGICYFLWDKDYNGDCKIVSHIGDKVSEPVTRPLLEKGLDVFIRYNEAISILNKVRKFNEESFSNIVSARKPFGLPTNFSGFKKNKDSRHNILLYKFGDNGYISDAEIERNHSYVNDWKVFVPYSSPGDDSYPHLILSKPIVAGKDTCCSETYLLIGPFANKKTANNVAIYMTTFFFRFMILLAKSAQHVTKKNYVFVPQQNFDNVWTDEKLFKKYDFSEDEIIFIKSLIRPMNINYE